jgi:FkbM family methyltransferase
MENTLEAAVSVTSEIASLDVALPVVIYGAGNCGQAMCRALIERGYRVCAFADRDKRGKVEGLPCYTPDDGQVQLAREANATLVLGLWNCAVDIPQLKREFLAHGWARVVAYPEWIELFAACIEPYWLAPRKMYTDPEVQKRIEQVAPLWADDNSRDLFGHAIKARLSTDLECLNAPVRGPQVGQYFAPEILDWPPPKRFIDCGAYDGDTIRELPVAIEAVAAFEPDLKNFRALAQTSREILPQAEVLLWPCGAWNETSSLSFSDGAGSASHLGIGGAIVPVVALDDVLQNFEPDFIKMDIEGAEYDALLDAQRIIEKHLPSLAICVYHRPEDIWRIPLLIASWNYGYEFFLRAHNFNGFDWVLYARRSST